MTDSDVRSALRRAAEVGPYFAVDRYTEGQGWHSLNELLDDEDQLLERVAFVRDSLGSRTKSTVELRVGASISSLDLVSRVVSPALASATLAGIVPRLSPGATYWRPIGGGPMQIAGRDVTGYSVSTTDDATTWILEAVLVPTVAPLAARYASQFNLSRHVLWGNVASALAGAAAMLLCADVDLRLDPVDVVDALLRRSPLQGSGRYERRFPTRTDRLFVRHNCCLFYRIPGGGTCADCILVPDASRGASGTD